MLAWWVIAIGRVCGTAIGTEPIDTTRVTPNRSTTRRTAPANASQRLSGSGPCSRRYGVSPVSRSSRTTSRGRVVRLVVVAHERHRRPAGPVVVELVDVEGRDHPGLGEVHEVLGRRAAALPASRNPSRASTIGSRSDAVELGHVVDDVHERGFGHV